MVDRVEQAVAGATEASEAASADGAVVALVLYRMRRRVHVERVVCEDAVDGVDGWWRW
jgi:hypothetical protein